MNPYQVLGVSQTADEDTIKKAYRKAAKECHPDAHPGDIEKEFERFFSMGKQSEKKENRTQQKINPMDVTDLFERYMGLKR